MVEPVDDFRVTNPASNQALLDTLARDFVSNGYSLRHTVRLILNSRVYQLDGFREWSSHLPPSVRGKDRVGMPELTLESRK